MTNEPAQNASSTAQEQGFWLLVAVFCRIADFSGEHGFRLEGVLNQIIAKHGPEDAPSLETTPAGSATVTLALLVAAKEANSEAPLLQTEWFSPDEISYGSSPVQFPAFENGFAAALLQAELWFTSPGRHWMTVSIDDRILTRVPLDVVYEADPTQPTKASEQH